MVNYLEALRQIESEAVNRIARTESVPVLESMNRILSGPVHAEESVPGFDNSAMDGFAIRLNDLVPGKNQIPVLKRIIAGVTTEPILEKGVAIEIMTGAPIPAGGFDGVIRVEDVVKKTNADGSFLIEFENQAKPGQNIRLAGEDYKPGDRIADVGTRIDAKLLMGMSALGVRKVQVYRPLKVWVISTGNEIVEPDQPELKTGEVRNSNAPFLLQELGKMGCEVEYQGVVNDEASSPGDSPQYRKLMERALSQEVDLVISTGAVSMGVHDFVPGAIRALGGEILFHKAKIRPGKPVLFARFEHFPRTLLFGLPGNPVSTVVGTEFFVKPCIRKMLTVGPSPRILGRIKATASKPEGLRCFMKAHWSVDEKGESQISILKGQASFMIHSLQNANAWAVLPEEGDEVKAGTLVEVNPFPERFEG